MKGTALGVQVCLMCIALAVGLVTLFAQVTVYSKGYQKVDEREKNTV